MNDDNTPTFKGGQAKLASDMQTVLTDAQELMRLAANEAGQGVKEAKERLQQSSQAARQQLASMQENAMRTAREAGDSAEGYVRDHPWEAIGISAGLGMLLGILIARR
jgi:ElaB/YqjD/DUF883 family membrane-anchored ribosome-binding protein